MIQLSYDDSCHIDRVQQEHDWMDGSRANIHKSRLSFPSTAVITFATDFCNHSFISDKLSLCLCVTSLRLLVSKCHATPPTSLWKMKFGSDPGTTDYESVTRHHHRRNEPNHLRKSCRWCKAWCSIPNQKFVQHCCQCFSMAWARSLTCTELNTEV